VYCLCIVTFVNYKIHGVPSFHTSFVEVLEAILNYDSFKFVLFSFIAIYYFIFNVALTSM
jgi:hypothetical protein